MKIDGSYTFKAPRERVYRAFLDPGAMCKWIAPYGFTCTVHAMDVRVGGRYRMSFTNFGTGSSHAFGGEYVELKPSERIRYTDRFEDPNLPGEMATTVTLRAVMGGTEVQIVQEGVPAMIPAEMCHLGWQESLAQLAHLVEPEIPAWATMMPWAATGVAPRPAQGGCEANVTDIITSGNTAYVTAEAPPPGAIF